MPWAVAHPPSAARSGEAEIRTRACTARIRLRNARKTAGRDRHAGGAQHAFRDAAAVAAVARLGLGARSDREEDAAVAAVVASAVDLRSGERDGATREDRFGAVLD